MIVFDLECRAAGHRFEGWFGSGDDFSSQQARGLVSCPQCGSSDVVKAPMAPAVPRKGNQIETRPAQPAAPPQQAMQAPALPPEAAQVIRAIAEMQAEVIKRSRWVGGNFAEESRAMHYGERAAEPIYGEASLEDAKALAEEGIEVAPVLFPVAPPDKTN